MAPANGEPRALGHVGLHGRVGDVLRLDPATRLHLVEVPATVLEPHEDIDAHEHAVEEERGLVEDGRALCKQTLGGLERFGRVQVVVGDLDAACEELLGEPTDLGALIEDPLLGLVDRGREFGRVNRKPQRLLALQALLEA